MAGGKKYIINISLNEKNLGKGAIDPSDRKAAEQLVLHASRKLSGANMAKFVHEGLLSVKKQFEETGTIFDPGEGEEEADEE